VTTIVYQGKASSIEYSHKIIAKVNDLSIALDWKIETMEENMIVVTPHPKCESLSFIFDYKLKIEGFMKTVYAPVEIHKQLVTLLFEVKPLFKKLIIKDDTGYWDAYVESRLGGSIRIVRVL
jgi:hypothetical protein